MSERTAGDKAEGKRMPGCGSDLEALAEEIARIRPTPSGIRAILESVYRDGQIDPRHEAREKILREGRENGIKDVLHVLRGLPHYDEARLVWKKAAIDAIEAMIEESR